MKFLETVSLFLMLSSPFYAAAAFSASEEASSAALTATSSAAATSSSFSGVFGCRRKANPSGTRRSRNDKIKPFDEISPLS